jgi:hypothetical protein|tara:strand:+ start:276 stop:659 length:384 start_codon:yes stop_codon:yes gene_type:complete
MKENFNLHSWKYNQLMEEVRDEIQSQIDGIIPLISKIDFTYTDFGRLYKIQVYDESGDELTIKDEKDYRGERRFDDDDIRYVANKLGIQVDSTFGGKSYDSSYYADLVPVFDNIGIELEHGDIMDVS